MKYKIVLFLLVLSIIVVGVMCLYKIRHIDNISLKTTDKQITNTESNSYPSSKFKERSVKTLEKGCKINYRFRLRVKHPFFLFSFPKTKDLTYEDKLIRIKFSFPHWEITEIEFSLFNKTNSALEIDFNRISFIDDSRKAHKVFHSGVRYIEREKLQAPLIVPARTEVEDVLVPTDYVYYDNYWEKIPLLPHYVEKVPALYLRRSGWISPEEFRGLRKVAHKGKLALKVFMPLKIDGKFKDYTFTFQITDMTCD